MSLTVIPGLGCPIIVSVVPSASWLSAIFTKAQFISLGYLITPESSCRYYSIIAVGCLNSVVSPCNHT